jgi:C4-dicarboxylate-specific signal transduction histidine kinase
VEKARGRRPGRRGLRGRFVVNAFEAMRVTPTGERRVIIHSERESEDRVQVSVRDFGTGLPVQGPEWIFERFLSTKCDGMGLAIARSIVTSHGGACLYFSLPALAIGQAG